jgi:hypothetical protein
MIDMEVSDRIGTSVLFENDRVRVWEMILDPGEAIPLHKHVNDYLVIYLAPTHLDLFFQGREPRSQSYDDGFVQYFVVGKEGTPHQIRNTGLEPHRQFIIELLGESVSPHELEPQTNERWL